MEARLLLATFSVTNTGDTLNQNLSRNQTQFTPSILSIDPTTPGSRAVSVVVGDFNHDLKPDIAVLESVPTESGNIGKVFVLLGKGDGTFRKEGPFSVGLANSRVPTIGPDHITFGDFSHNGFPDLVVTSFNSSTVSVLRNNHDGTFRQVEPDYPVGTEPQQSVVGDFNHDGKLDIATVRSVSNPQNSETPPQGVVSFLFGNGDGTFQRQTPVSTSEDVGPSSYSLATADLNGDGLTDIVTANLGKFRPPPFDAPHNTISVLLNDPLHPGRFKNPLGPPIHDTYTVGNGANSVALVDLNKDNKPDIVVSNILDSSISVLLNKGNGTFATPVTIPLFQTMAGGVTLRTNPSGIEVVDLNHDGNPDLVITSRRNAVILSHDPGPRFAGLIVLLGKNNGTFQAPLFYNTRGGTLTGDARTGDFNGDGLPDIVSANNIDDTITLLMSQGVGTLRQAILDANSHPGPDNIVFKIPGTGVHTIQIGTTPLPTITDPVFIDGYSQSGARSNSLANGDNAKLMVELRGNSNTFGHDGLSIDASLAGQTVVRGLVIDQFTGNGINVFNSGSIRVAPRIKIQGNFIGTNPDGNVARGNQLHGVQISLSPTGVTVGGTDPQARNLISGNAVSGVLISKATGDVVSGNFIGTDRTGTQRLANGVGVLLSQGAQANTIGGRTPGARNIIAGNADSGVVIQGQSALDASGNHVVGNFIGIGATGRSLGNSSYGVMISGPASDNVIGGTSSSAGNVISGNGVAGVVILNSDAIKNRIQGNKIGTNPTGRAAIPNGGDGIYIGDAPRNIIGGIGTGAGNLISGNRFDGIQIQGHAASGNQILGNTIGANIDGTRSLGNFYDGVYLNDAPANLIGWTTTGAGNLISGNANGVRIFNAGASHNQILGNTIGLNAKGRGALPNLYDGVFIDGAPNNQIGGTAAGAANVISGNGSVGVQLFALGASGNRVQGNKIGTDLGGQGILGNLGDGVFLNNAPGNLIGGTTAPDGNLIANNAFLGVELVGTRTSGNLVQNNTLRQNARGAISSTGAGSNSIGPNTGA